MVEEDAGDGVDVGIGVFLVGSVSKRPGLDMMAMVPNARFERGAWY